MAAPPPGHVHAALRLPEGVSPAKGASDWVTDQETTPATLVEQTTQRVVSKLEVPLNPGEDRAIWSADSQRGAVSVPANKFIKAKVFIREGEGFVEVELPYLGELEIEVKPVRSGQGESQARLDYDNVLPV